MNELNKLQQNIEYINIADLILWNENPRDPINVEATDQDIVDKAINDDSKKWGLPKLAKEMGGYYDFSELPTVVYSNGIPVVYDGNRRIILAKLKHNLVQMEGYSNIKLPDIPESLPCNVCSEEIALKNILRKHGDSGSWGPLERDIFLHNFMNEEKSLFLILDEHTGLITGNILLNQGFVKDEIFTKSMLSKLGFKIDVGGIKSQHNKDEASSILNDITFQINSKNISTRKNRGKLFDVLEQSTKETIEKNKKNPFKKHNNKFELDGQKHATNKRTKRKKESSPHLFGGKLSLKSGLVNNLYRDIDAIYNEFYVKNKSKLSKNFIVIIRISLRLLAESAGKDVQLDLNKYVTTNFDAAKKSLNDNDRTILSVHNINKNSITQLLHIGAHQYDAAKNLEQTIAISIILGEILTNTHGQGLNK